MNTILYLTLLNRPILYIESKMTTMGKSKKHKFKRYFANCHDIDKIANEVFGGFSLTMKQIRAEEQERINDDEPNEED